MPIYGILILQSIRCSPTLWAVTQPSQFRSIMDKDEFVREPKISLYIYNYHFTLKSNAIFIFNFTVTFAKLYSNRLQLSYPYHFHSLYFGELADYM